MRGRLPWKRGLALPVLLLLARCASERPVSEPAPGGTDDAGVVTTVDAKAPDVPPRAVDAAVRDAGVVCIPSPTPPVFRVEVVAEDLFVPWSLAFLPNGDLLVAEREGRIRIVRGGTALDPKPVPGLPPIHSGPQGGLHGLVLHPDFPTKPFVYLAYTDESPIDDPPYLGERVTRYRWQDETLVDPLVLVDGSFPTQSDDHFGGRLAFGADRKLYVTLGDRHMFYHPQDPGKLEGKVLRLEDDGRVPADNPFVGRADALPEVFTYGHRNPQGLAVQPSTGLLFETEHGDNGGDEINILEPGRNYGHPLYEKDAGAPGITTPILQFTPAIAPSGATFYASNTLRGWCGSLFVAGLASNKILRIPFEARVPGEPESLLEGTHGRIRTVAESPEGFLYFSEDLNGGAHIWRIVPGP